MAAFFSLRFQLAFFHIAIKVDVIIFRIWPVVMVRRKLWIPSFWRNFNSVEMMGKIINAITKRSELSNYLVDTGKPSWYECREILLNWKWMLDSKENGQVPYISSSMSIQSDIDEIIRRGFISFVCLFFKIGFGFYQKKNPLTFLEAMCHKHYRSI